MRRTGPILIAAYRFLLDATVGCGVDGTSSALDCILGSGCNNNENAAYNDGSEVLEPVPPGASEDEFAPRVLSREVSVKI